jgi:hypothetical protein
MFQLVPWQQRQRRGDSERREDHINELLAKEDKKYHMLDGVSKFIQHLATLHNGDSSTSVTKCERLVLQVIINCIRK